MKGLIEVTGSETGQKILVGINKIIRVSRFELEGKEFTGIVSEGGLQTGCIETESEIRALIEASQREERE